MASVTFVIHGKRNPANIYIRYTEGKDVDVQVKTGLFIDPGGWNQKKQSPTRLASADMRNLSTRLFNLKQSLIEHSSAYKGVKDLEWLRSFVKPVSTDKNDSLSDLFDSYIESKGKTLSASTVRKIKSVKNRVEGFKKSVRIESVNDSFRIGLEKHLRQEGYADNTILSTIKTLKAVCNQAKRKGFTVSNELEFFGGTYKKADNTYLSFKELKNLTDIDFDDRDLSIARDWLIISCYTAQRVSDFMRFDMSMVFTIDNQRYISFKQNKTGKNVTLPLFAEVESVLSKYGDRFPPKMLPQPYNYLIKKVCEKAGITQMECGGKMDEGRKKTGYFPKNELISSKIGRKSFATNYYGILPLSLIKSATGHDTEKSLLTYIGRSEMDSAIQLAETVRKLKDQGVI